MRIIQSVWACGRSNPIINQPSWLAPEYGLMSLALSALQLKKYYNDLVLYTDSTYAKILIDQLNLPYTEVHCELDNLNHYHPGLWAIPKIHVYSKQYEPFLHVDGDVFIWKEFSQELVENELVAQNLESATRYYSNIMNELEANLDYFPSEILEERRSNNSIHAYNAGIFGGSDSGFFREYATKAFEFVKKNERALSKITVENFNIFFEQYLFYCLAKKQKKKVGVLFADVIGDNQYKGLGDFCEVPHNKQYVHLLGNYKRSESMCLQLASRLRQDYPEYYYRIISLYRNSKCPLLHDYYSHLHKDVDLFKRQEVLKQQYNFGELNSLDNSLWGKNNLCKVNELVSDLDQNMEVDLKLFYEKIVMLKKEKFINLSYDYLYGRDLNATYYFEYLFTDLDDIYTKNLVAQPYTQTISSEFDWSDISNPNFNIDTISKQPNSILIALIPECNKYGYSLTKIDLLDVEILSVLRNEMPVGRLLEECKDLFDTEDMKNSRAEYIMLIMGRIKKGIFNKTIRAVF